MTHECQNLAQIQNKEKNKNLNMGNYKSRPQTSCSEELRKKIIEFHVVLRKKLQNDLQMPLPNEMSEFVEACALAQTERISTFAKIEEINQLIEEKGLYPCHLCCQSSSVVSTSIGCKKGSLQKESLQNKSL